MPASKNAATAANDKTATAAKPVSKVRQFVNDAQAGRSAPVTRKTASRKPTLTPAERAHRAVLADIKKQPDYAAARSTWQQLASKVEDLRAVKTDVLGRAKSQDHLRIKAATDQDYKAAQEHKEQHAALTAQAEAIGAELGPLVELCAAAAARHAELLLADPKARFNQAEDVTVTMLRVIDPETLTYASAYYVDSDTIIQLSLNGQHFESEAYNAQQWAESKGFVVRRNERTISL